MVNGIRIKRVFDQAHAAMEPGKTISMSKFHEMTGHTGEHLLKPTANYMKLKLIGTLPLCEACAKAKIRQRNIPPQKWRNYQPALGIGYSWTYVLSNKSAEEETGTG